MDDKCRTCTIKCRQADHIHETALGRMYAMNELLSYVKKVDSGELVEVVHGRWVLQRYYGGVRKGMVARVICSECGYPNGKTNYCPQCGAKMDGERKDNESMVG